jgi:NitT/TauT family transport system ATP-binding protein
MSAPGSSIDVHIRDLSRTYESQKGKVVALRDINLDISETQFVSILGPSGCGKSTLLRCIAGLARPTSGVLKIGGKSVTAPPEDMGMVFQRDVLLDWRTSLENVLLPIEFKGLDKAKWTERARSLLDLLGLSNFKDRHPWELSGGMRQRVAICRALLLNPSLLLMDEPFGALDAMTRDDLNLELQRIWMDRKNLVIFVTHSIVEAVFLSDRVLVMSKSPGTIVEDIHIDLERPRPLAIRETKEFGRYVGHMREIFESLGSRKGMA